MSYTRSDMVLEDRDFSVPSPVHLSIVSSVPMSIAVSSVQTSAVSPVQNTGIHVSPREDLQVSSTMNRFLNGARVDPIYTSVPNIGQDRHVSQVGWSSPVSRTISYRESDSQRTPLFKESGMDERFSIESY